MPRLTVVYWRDIPAQVIVKEGRKSAKRPLAERFEKAIDQAAMRAKLRDTDSYLAEWRRDDAGPCGEDMETEAQAAAERLERDYDDARLKSLIEAGGLDGAASTDRPRGSASGAE